MFLAALDQTIVATALPTIGRQFNDVSNLSWVITAYLLASTAVAPVFGTLSDIYGRRVMITVSLVLFTAGSILCAVAPNMPVLIVARGLQGLGGVLLMASAVVVMLVLTWGGNRYAWLSPAIMAMIGASVALAFAFVWHARKADEAFLPLPLMSGTVVPYAMMAGGCALGAITGLTVHLPLYYEVVYHLTASQAGLALIPLAAISTCGAAIAGRTMARAKHYKRVAIAGTSAAAIFGAVLTVTTLPLWGLLVVLSLFALGLGTTFPVSVVSLQNSVARAQIGTVTGAMNFFRSLMSSFTVAAFSAILLMVLGAGISLGEHRGPANAIPVADMIIAFRYVFGAATALLVCAAFCIILMEERPLAGPSTPAELAE
jgi:MFS family permease